MVKTAIKHKKTASAGDYARNKKAVILLVLAAVFAVIGGYAASQTFAQSDVKVCNSSASNSSSPYGNYISAYKNFDNWSQDLAPGDCTTWVSSTGADPVRVDTNSQAGSYKVGKIGQAYGACHEGWNKESEPGSAAEGVRYRIYPTRDCT